MTRSEGRAASFSDRCVRRSSDARYDLTTVGLDRTVGTWQPIGGRGHDHRLRCLAGENGMRKLFSRIWIGAVLVVFGLAGSAQASGRATDQKEEKKNALAM